MGKKPAERGAPQPEGQSEIIPALSKANEAMKIAYDAEYGQRLQLVRENEAMERESLAVEVHIKGLTDQGEDLDEVVGRLTERRDALKEKVDGLTGERDSLASENAELGDLQKQLDAETSRLRKLQEDYMSAVGKFREARKKITGAGS